MILNSSFTDWINHFLDYMGGCFGCGKKPSPITAVDEPSKGLKIQGRTVKKTSISDDFWSTSTCDLENSAIQSQRSVSSISISNQSLCPGGSTSNNSEFVNHGFHRWNQGRLQWVESKKSERKGKAKDPVLRLPVNMIQPGMGLFKWICDGGDEFPNNGYFQKIFQIHLTGFNPADSQTLRCLKLVSIGMQLMNACLERINASLSQSLYPKWWTFWWIYGSKKDYMTDDSNSNRE